MKLQKNHTRLEIAVRSVGLFLASLLMSLGVCGLVPSVKVLGLGKQSSYNYVAFGDSLTTGSSVATCYESRKGSPWGCRETPTAAVPYPDKVAQNLHMIYSDSPYGYGQEIFSSKLGLYRAGIWGYTLQEAVAAQRSGRNADGSWTPQLDAIKKARQLVTGALGINDMHFSDIAKWARLYARPGKDYITPEARKIIQTRKADFNQLFKSLEAARDNGAKVIVGLYYNPYDTADAQCAPLKDIGDRIVTALDNELLDRSHRSGLSVADFRRPFTGHGAGSSKPYVFGTDCRLTAAVRTSLFGAFTKRNVKQQIAIKFDPHPNNAGTSAMANLILREFNNAD